MKFDLHHKVYDLVVIGGGIGGTIAAVTAARRGLKTALVENKAGLGGNGGSAIGVNFEGSRHPDLAAVPVVISAVDDASGEIDENIGPFQFSSPCPEGLAVPSDDPPGRRLDTSRSGCVSADDDNLVSLAMKVTR